MKNYNDLEIIHVLLKRWKLFSITLIVFLILGSVWVRGQVNAIREADNAYEEKMADINTDKLSLLKVNIAIPQQVIDGMAAHFIDRGILNDFRKYISLGEYNIYLLYFNREVDMDFIVESLLNNPIIKDIESSSYDKNAMVSKMDGELDINQIGRLKGSPINRHFIQLDKDRNPQIMYYSDITSTKIIKNHPSLSTSKIWVFMAICSIMIALFITFSVESAHNIKKALKKGLKA